MADDPNTNLQVLFPGIVKDEIAKACKKFNYHPFISLDDNELRDSLDNVWFNVNRLLGKDRTPNSNRRPANLDEFNENVKTRGEDRFLRLLRDTAEDVRVNGVIRWANLFLDGACFSFPLKCSGHFRCLDVFYKPHENQVLYTTVLSRNGA